MSPHGITTTCRSRDLARHRHASRPDPGDPIRAVAAAHPHRRRPHAPRPGVATEIADHAARLRLPEPVAPASTGAPTT